MKDLAVKSKINILKAKLFSNLCCLFVFITNEMKCVTGFSHFDKIYLGNDIDFEIIS